MRFILRLKSREHVLLTSYKKEHPHFFAYLALDAFLSIALVFGAVQIGSSLEGATPTHELLMDVGGHALSADELIAHVPSSSHNGKPYWLGAYSGYSYTTNYMTPGVLVVTYMTPGKNIESNGEPVLTITSYESEAFLKSGMSGRVHQETNTTNARGDSIIYDSALMNKIEVTRAQTSEIVVIDYNIGQNFSSMIQDSENLRTLN